MYNDEDYVLENIPVSYVIAHNYANEILDKINEYEEVNEETKLSDKCMRDSGGARRVLEGATAPPVGSIYPPVGRIFSSNLIPMLYVNMGLIHYFLAYLYLGW